MIPQSQVEGAIFLMIMFEGTSRRIYLFDINFFLSPKVMS
jgi:hypothetical protein